MTGTQNTGQPSRNRCTLCNLWCHLALNEVLTGKDEIAGWCTLNPKWEEIKDGDKHWCGHFETYCEGDHVWPQ